MIQTIGDIIKKAKEAGYEDLACILKHAKPLLQIDTVKEFKVGCDDCGTSSDPETLYFLTGKEEKHKENSIFFSKQAEMYKMAYQMLDVMRRAELGWYDKIIEANLKFNDITLKRPDLVTMMKYFNQLMKNPVAVYDEFFNIIAITDEKLREYEEEQIEPQRYEMRNLFYYKQKVFFCGHHATKECCNRLLFPVLPAGGGIWKGYLAIFDLETPYEEMDMMILEIFANSALTEMRRQLELQEVERKYVSDFIYDLIYRKEEKAEEILRRAKGLNVAADADYCMIAIKPIGDIRGWSTTDDKNRNIQYEFMNDRIMNNIDNFNRKYFEQDIVTKFDTSIYVLHKMGQHDLQEGLDAVKAHCVKLLKMLEEFFHDMSFQIGIGDTVHDLIDIASSFHQALAAISYGEIVNKDENYVMCYADYSLLKLFGRLKEIDCLDEMIPDNLQKIWDYDQRHHTQFYDTLKMYLNCNCSAKRAAEKLFVHYKTMLYRIEKLKSTFNIDLEDGSSRLFLELGIHLLDMQKK